MSRWLRDVRLIPIVLIAVEMASRHQAYEVSVSSPWRGAALRVVTVGNSFQTFVRVATTCYELFPCRRHEKTEYVHRVVEWTDGCCRRARSSFCGTVGFSGSNGGSFSRPKSTGKAPPRAVILKSLPSMVPLLSSIAAPSRLRSLS